MSLFSTTNLEEYARQCTLQRRRYEECLEQSQRSHAVDTSGTTTGAIAHAAEAQEFVEASQLDASAHQGGQSCMTDLLELPVDPFSWDGEALGSDNARTAVAEVHQRYNKRTQTPRKTAKNPTAKSPSAVSYGAP
ncbi:MAG: hypothetical protein KME42_08050 [Tildeniella nuda ZEHNDER 1965/U140]|jgi:hypothetical protein|nr:hypothetical protein [Tildeniella nuda ZEHNDER 1965/U140]